MIRQCKIVVCVKQMPGTKGKVELKLKLFEHEGGSCARGLLELPDRAYYIARCERSSVNCPFPQKRHAAPFLFHGASS